MSDPVLSTSPLPGKAIWIYTDGSAVTKQECLGTCASMIVFPDGTFEFIAAAQMWTKINRMELSAVNQGLYYLWAFWLKSGNRTAEEIDAAERAGIPRDWKPRVHIFTDSKYVVERMVEPETRYQNRDLWAAFNELAWHFDITIEHYGRNLEPAQNQCDAACDSLRQLFKEWVAAFKAHASFQGFAMQRGSLKMLLPENFPTHKE